MRFGKTSVSQRVDGALSPLVLIPFSRLATPKLWDLRAEGGLAGTVGRVSWLNGPSEYAIFAFTSPVVPKHASFERLIPNTYSQSEPSP